MFIEPYGKMEILGSIEELGCVQDMKLFKLEDYVGLLRKTEDMGKSSEPWKDGECVEMCIVYGNG